MMPTCIYKSFRFEEALTCGRDALEKCESLPDSQQLKAQHLRMIDSVINLSQTEGIPTSPRATSNLDTA